MTNKEMLARAIADELRPWLQRIRQLEVSNIEKGAEIRLLRELIINYRDAPSRPTKSIPFGPAPRIGRSGKDAH
jgi:hypothetical protein